MPTEASGIRLEIRIALNPPLIDIHYRLSNETDRSHGAFCRLPTTALDGMTVYLPGTAYVAIDNDTAQLKKMVLETPPGLQVAVRLLPGVMLIPAHGSLTERISRTLPLAVEDPYRQAQLVGKAGGKPVMPAAPVDIAAVSLSIGVFECAGDEKYTPVSPAYPDVFTVAPSGGAVMRQVVLTASARLEAPISGLDYGPAPPPP